MARVTRAPSQNAYRGALGRTQTQSVHVTGPRGELIAATVHTSIDALADPELVERLHLDELDVVRVDGPESSVPGGTPIRASVPVIYHDPAAELFVLVLGEAHRARELDERIRVYERLRDDPAAIPNYVKEFAVVFGAAGLRAYLEQRAQAALATARSHDGARAQEALAQREAELDRRHKELERTRAELQRLHAELKKQGAEVEKRHGDLERMRAEARQRVLAQVQTDGDEAMTTIGPPPKATPAARELGTTPVARQPAPPIVPAAAPAAALAPGDQDELATEIQQALPPRRQGSDFEHEVATGVDQAPHPESPITEPVVSGKPNGTARKPPKVEFDEEESTTGASAIPVGADPLTTETLEGAVPAAGSDPWLDFAATGATSAFHVDEGPRGGVRLALVAGEQLARGLGDALDVRVLLHRVTTYPVVVVVIAPPAALRAPSPAQAAVLPLDVGVDLDRTVLTELAKRFELAVDIIVRGRVIRRVKLVAPLADNVAYVLRAADDHLRGIAADGESTPSFTRARDLVLGAGYDLLGVEHAEHNEFRDDRLIQLDTAKHARRAIAIARRFARPSREDYLITARGFPLARWRELRRHVVEVAVGWGLWMGPELAQVAVSEGLARSRRDLISKLDAAFDALRRHPTAFDLDGDAADDNAKAIADEAKALGVELARKANGRGVAIKSEDVSTVSGSIERTPTQNIPRGKSTDELIALLDDKKLRMMAASELCDRGEARAAAAVIATAKKMSRAEAVRILGKSVKLGAAAAGPLMEGLSSSKGFLRHGCALALALLRTDEGTHAVVQLLLDEPTEIWREIARAIGQIGQGALMPLASHVGRLGDRLPAVSERVVWAMAHAGVRGGKAALEQMATGQSVMAPLAKQALGLLDNAARDEVRVVPGQPNRDVTVNRAFSRRFFEAVDSDRPEVRAALHDLEASGPHELDDADLIVDEDDADELDESDLIQG